MAKTKKRTVLTVALRDEPVMGSETGETQLRVVIATCNTTLDRGVDFDDGYADAADDIQDIVLGQIARMVNWEKEIRALYGDS